MAKAKRRIAGSTETEAIAGGDIDATSKSWKEDTSSLADPHRGCMTKAPVSEAETKVAAKR